MDKVNNRDGINSLIVLIFTTLAMVGLTVLAVCYNLALFAALGGFGSGVLFFCAVTVYDEQIKNTPPPNK